jgi:hypothetical protein
MRNRKSRRINPPDQNLDSFLDVLTNTVGALMFIILFMGLITAEAVSSSNRANSSSSEAGSSSIITTPLVSKTEKNPRFFEIRNNKITYIDDEKVGKDMETVIGNLPTCNKPDVDLNSEINSGQYLAALENYQACISNRASRLVDFQTQTDYYNVIMVNASTFSYRYDPIQSKPGETEAEFSLPESQFNQTLAKLDPKKDYLAFIVRPDSFASFRTAREQAWAQGFNVGWEPHKPELSIQFGSGGEAIDVQ